MIQMIESTQGSDAAAVERTLAGDPDAYRVLVERHSRNLFRLAYRMTSNEQDAEEIVQDAFLRAYRKLAQFESRANFGTWVYRIAVNCALDRRRTINASPPKLNEVRALLLYVRSAMVLRFIVRLSKSSLVGRLAKLGSINSSG